MESATKVYNDCVQAVNQNKRICSNNYKALNIRVSVVTIERKSLRKIPLQVVFQEDTNYPSLRKLKYKSVYLNTFLNYLYKGSYNLRYSEEFLHQIENNLRILVEYGKIDK